MGFTTRRRWRYALKYNVPNLTITPVRVALKESTSKRLLHFPLTKSSSVAPPFGYNFALLWADEKFETKYLTNFFFQVKMNTKEILSRICSHWRERISMTSAATKPSRRLGTSRPVLAPDDQMQSPVICSCLGVAVTTVVWALQ